MKLAYPKPKDQKRRKSEAVRTFRDGREVTQPNAAGYAEYSRRKYLMLERQGFKCATQCSPLCETRGNLGYLGPEDATFGHVDGRGMGGAKRDDRIMKDGKPYNEAQCQYCNDMLGSKGRNHD